MQCSAGKEAKQGFSKPEPLPVASRPICSTAGRRRKHALACRHGETENRLAYVGFGLGPNPSLSLRVRIRD